MVVAILGGTGEEGLGIAARLAAAGDEIVIGSRAAERAEKAAQGLREKLPNASIRGFENHPAADGAEVVFLSVPFGGLEPTLETCGSALDGKVVVDLVVPLERRKGVFHASTVEQGSVGELVRDRAPNAHVVSAFKNQSAHELLELDKPVEGDVLYAGDDDHAKEVLRGLVSKIPNLRAVDAGPLGISRHLEVVTALLINLNRRHKAHSTIQILGIS